MLDARKEEAFCTILREELQLATGCTEPIAVAYCAARLRQVLGERPRRILAEVSGNILKNVKSVVVPNTGGRRGNTFSMPPPRSTCFWTSRATFPAAFTRSTR